MISKTYREIIKNVSEHVTWLPPYSRIRLVVWLFYGTVIRKPGRPKPGLQWSKVAQNAVEFQVKLFLGYMVIFAHDDAVDKYNLTTEQIYDQLSRCLTGYVLGVFFDESIVDAERLKDEMLNWMDILNDRLSRYPDVNKELHYLFDSKMLWRDIAQNKKISVGDILIKSGFDELCQEWLNASIVSAYGMGRAYRSLSDLLRVYLDENILVQQKRLSFFIELLVQCMHAQAHSPEQKSWETIQYGRFVELTYFKSTILLDIYNYVSDMVNEDRFFDIRHNASRACDQIFDDLRDYKEDTKDKVLGILHMHILEQGRIAEKYLLIGNREKMTNEMINELINDTKILGGTYEDAFIYQNPFVAAPRDSRGELTMEPNEAETILREIWVNSPVETTWSIEKLALHRAALARRFRLAWQAKDDTVVLDVIYQSNFPMALAKSYYRFMHQNKQVIIGAYKKYDAWIAGYISYYVAVIGLIAFWMNFWFQRMFRLSRFR